MTEPTRDALHAETLAWLNTCLLVNDHPVVAYAAECVKRVPKLEAEVERLTASNRKLTTMLEEEAYHRMAAESRAQPDGGNVRIEVTDSAEVERLRARVEVLRGFATHKDWCLASARGVSDRHCNCELAAATREGTDA